VGGTCQSVGPKPEGGRENRVSILDPRGDSWGTGVVGGKRSRRALFLFGLPGFGGKQSTTRKEIRGKTAKETRRYVYGSAEGILENQVHEEEEFPRIAAQYILIVHLSSTRKVAGALLPNRLLRQKGGKSLSRRGFSEGRKTGRSWGAPKNRTIFPRRSGPGDPIRYLDKGWGKKWVLQIRRE